MNKDEFTRKFGEKLTQLMSENEISNKELADKMGVTERTIQRYKRGMNAPKVWELDKLAEAIGTSKLVLLNIK